MNNHKGWPLYDFLPDGFMIDKSCGSPLQGYEFAINDSLLKGGKRILVKAHPPQNQPRLDAPTISIKETVADESPKVEQPYPARTVNELARERFKLKLLNDIRCDLMVCELEGWDKMEYINEIRNLIAGIGAQSIIRGDV